MTIRDATPEDLPALLALIESAYRGDSARRGWTHEADLLGGQRTDAAALAAVLADPDQAMLVATTSAGLAGCVRLGKVAPAMVQIGMLSVAPDAQAQGTGRRLLAAAEAAAAARMAAGRAELEVIRQRTELIDWYRRRGYRVTGEERPFPHGDARFGLPRRDDLAFAVLVKELH
jgi:ribosomal protein S18 acetylase RimI-like enzyme